jgi:hypothetical protein
MDKTTTQLVKKIQQTTPSAFSDTFLYSTRPQSLSRSAPLTHITSHHITHHTTHNTSTYIITSSHTILYYDVFCSSHTMFTHTRHVNTLHALCMSVYLRLDLCCNNQSSSSYQCRNKHCNHQYTHSNTHTHSVYIYPVYISFILCVRLLLFIPP